MDALKGLKLKPNQILFSGGSGLLGGEVKKLLPQALYPNSKAFNVVNFHQTQKFIRGKGIRMIIHAAAATATGQIEKNPLSALEINIIGTANMVKLCWLNNIKLVYISTDYVFKGDKGNYKETDPVWPVNKYAWSKLGGECAVQLLNNFIIIRTSFGPPSFPHDSAFTNQWTSKEPVKKIAEKIVRLIKFGPNFNGIVNLGGKRKSLFEYAKGLDAKKQIKKMKMPRPRPGEMSRPVDASLNSSLFNSLTKHKQ